MYIYFLRFCEQELGGGIVTNQKKKDSLETILQEGTCFTTAFGRGLAGYSRYGNGGTRRGAVGKQV